MSRSRKLSLLAFLRSCGAEILPLCQNEQARFRARDTLCIIYARNRKGRVSCVSEIAQEAFGAWEAGRKIDLSNTPEAEPKSHRAQGKIVIDMVARVRAGETLDIVETAEAVGFSADRVARIGSAWGLRVSGGKITRVAA